MASDGCMAVIERLYAAALAPQEWQGAIGALAHYLDADHAFLTHAAESWSGGLFMAGAGLASADLARFAAFAPRSDRGVLAGAPDLYAPGKVVSSADIMSDRQVEGSVLYNEVIRPAGGFYSLTSVGAADSSFNMAVCRGRAAGAFDSEARRRAEVLAPHVSTALQIHHRLRRAEDREAAGTALLEQAGGAVILWEDGGPQFMNSRALSLLDKADGLGFGEDGGLAAADTATTRRLRLALATAGSDLATAQRIALRRPSGRPPLIASILPASRSGGGLGRPGAVALFIQEPGEPPRIDPEALCDLFALTLREAEVAVRLAAGAAPGEIALSMGIGVGTVRSHLKQVYGKTGAHTQAGLVTLLHSCTHPIW